jgi:probable O-glycosylation ligase (exosortase A-associated)
MRDIALTALIFAIIPFCLRKPWVGTIAWYWFGLMNPHRLTWGFAYTMPFAMLIGGATLLGAVTAKDRRPIPWNRELKVLCVLMIYFVFTTIFAWAPDHAWEEWKKVFKVVLMTYVATMFIYGKDRITTLMLTIVLSIGFYAAKGIFYVIRTGGGGRIDGIPGSFLDGNTFMGLAFCMVAPVMFVLARIETRPGRRRGLYTLAVVTLIAVIFTYSRGAYLGLAAILPLLFLRAKSKLVATCLLVPTLLIAPFVLPDRANERIDALENYEQESSANQRLQAWTVAWNLAKDRPFTGGGFEFEYADDSRWLQYASAEYFWALQRASAAHSIYFQVLGQHGFVALGLYLMLLVGTLLSLQRTKRLAEKKPDTSWIGTYASGLQMGMAGYMVSGAFLNSAYFDLALLYIAFSAILSREVRLVSAQAAQQPDQSIQVVPPSLVHGPATPRTLTTR